jgi:hypothetical protein
VFYATPQSTERGVVPGAQFFRLNSGLAGANVSTAQSIFGVGVTLSSSTVYAFETVIAFTKSAGATSHTIGLGFGGTATVGGIQTNFIGSAATSAATSVLPGQLYNGYLVSTANTAVSGAIAGATLNVWYSIKGTVSITTGGTFIPQYTLSAAPGGAYTTVAGSYFLIYPIGASGANTNVGTWA